MKSFRKILLIATKKILPKIIFLLQDAIIQGRDIDDSTIVAHKILNSFSKNQKKTF